MKMLVLAGGFGTRLEPVVPDLPKALAPVNGVPFLGLLMQRWINQGLSDFTFLLHHRSDQLISFLDVQKTLIPAHVHVNWVVEPKPLGTGGSIANAVSKLNLIDDFLVANADTWLDSGVDKLMEVEPPAVLVAYKFDTGRYGRIESGRDGLVLQINEKCSIKSAGWVSAGVYKFSPNMFQFMANTAFSLERGFLKNLVEKNMLKSVPILEDFVDIGVPADYQNFCQKYKA